MLKIGVVLPWCEVAINLATVPAVAASASSSFQLNNRIDAFLNCSRREGLNSFDLRDAGLTDTSASGSCQALFVPGATFYLAGPTSSERGDERIQATKSSAVRPSRPKARFRAR